MSDISSALGRFMLDFQLLENELREIVWFCATPMPSPERRNPKFSEVVIQARRAVATYFQTFAVEASDSQAVTQVFDKCVAVNQRRNRLVHSTYRHHELVAGGSMVIRTYSAPATAGQLKTEYEEMGDSTFEVDLAEIRHVFDELRRLHRRMMYEFPIPLSASASA